MRRLVIPAGPNEREQSARPMGVLGPNSHFLAPFVCVLVKFLLSLVVGL